MECEFCGFPVDGKYRLTPLDELWLCESCVIDEEERSEEEGINLPIERIREW